MLFSKQTSFYTLSPETDYKWVAKSLSVVNQDTDLAFCPTEWPKNCQIAPNLWLFFGGGDPEVQPVHHRPAMTTVTQLDTETHKLTIFTQIPAKTLAH